MILAITQRLIKDEHGTWVDSLELNYSQLFIDLGNTVIPVSNAPGAVDNCIQNFKPQGLILSGGGNINVNYEKINPPADQLRERTESILLDYAIINKIPVLGICRGMQFINLYFNGNICTNIHEKVKNHQPGVKHSIKLSESILEQRLGNSDSIVCNSYHNQGVLIEDLSQELKVFAIADQIVEGLFHPNLPIAAIQWHPEREPELSELDRLIISAFLKKELFWRLR